MSNYVDKRLHISRDVIFNEPQEWKWCDTPEKGSDSSHVFAEHVQSDDLYKDIDVKGIEVEKYGQIETQTHARL